MAFNKEDTEILYEQLILPVLTRNGIEAVIVNRIESNEDLNLLIYEKIKECDFCIADLTYTRPSVYFEAGFAQRISPVIYTVRKDHLKRDNPDDMRVHFDLSMKNIIIWNGDDNEKFSDNLDKRIKNTILKEWGKKQLADAAIEEEKSEFMSKSVVSRLTLLRRNTINALIKKGYKKWNNILHFPTIDRYFMAKNIYSSASMKLPSNCPIR